MSKIILRNIAILMACVVFIGYSSTHKVYGMPCCNDLACDTNFDLCLNGANGCASLPPYEYDACSGTCSAQFNSCASTWCSYCDEAGNGSDWSSWCYTYSGVGCN